jgi:alpha/beta hydrolase fold
MHFPQTRSRALASSGMAGKALPTAAGVAMAAVASTLLNRWLAKTAEHRNPPIGRFITVEGVRLHYVERGTGTPLVLLHGNGSMIEDFQSSGVIDLAAKKYRLIAFDRPGFGHSERPRSTIWTPEAQADLITAALKKNRRATSDRSGTFLGNIGGSRSCCEVSARGPGPGSRLWLLLPERSSGCGDPIAAGHPADRRPFEPHHISSPEQADLAAASSQNFRPESGPREIQRLSKGDGCATVSDSSQCC